MSIPINHLILIPLVLGIGFLLGWRFGTQNILKQWHHADEKRRRAEE